MLGGYVEIIMIGSIVATSMIFLFMPMRQAMVTAYCVMWMFLPVYTLHLPSLPPLSKPAVISVGAFIAMILIYADVILKKYRFRWFDIPVILFGVVLPFISPVLNDQPIKTSLFETVNALFLWVVPYFAGRIVLGDEMGVHTLAVGLFFAALIYAPLAWMEMLLSPQLHRRVYGWHQHEFLQTRRGWSYRPMLFMTHGLMSSMWLAAGAICGIWLHMHKRLKWKWPGTPKLAVGFLFFTAAVSNSMGAVMLMFVGLAVLFATRRINPTWVLVPLLLVAPIYLIVRTTNVVTRADLVEIVHPLSAARSRSLDFRLQAEDAYVAKGMEKPVIGWGGDGEHRPMDEATGKYYVADGLWIHVFSRNGMLGLIAMTLSLLSVPTLIFIRHGTRIWREPRFAATGALSVLMVIYTIDNLLNAMINPYYMLVLGALATFATQPLDKLFPSRRQVAKARARRERAIAEKQGQPADQEAYDRPVGLSL